MTAPANPPPQTVLQSLVADRAPFTSVALAATTAYDLTTKAVWSISAQPPPCAAEIVCVTAGTLQAQLAGDTGMQSYPMTAGQVLKGAFVLIGAATTGTYVARF